MLGASKRLVNRCDSQWVDPDLRPSHIDRCRMIAGKKSTRHPFERSFIDSQLKYNMRAIGTVAGLGGASKRRLKKIT